MKVYDEPIDWSSDTLDSRDIEGRRAYLADEIDTYDFEANEPEANLLYDADEIAEMREELKALNEFCQYSEGYSGDWNSGATLIADDFFETYAEEYATELELVPNSDQWPSGYIDWKAAAEALQMDYTAVEDPDGNTWWVR